MSSAINLYKKIAIGKETPLKSSARFPKAAHYWSEPEREALTLALAAGRPLLVRGEAGSGKSQLARAAAHELSAELLVEVVHARFEASDLKYRLDLVRRLADAESGDPEARQRVGCWREYYDPGVYWQACKLSQKNRATVLLIDEIDKADSDIPNALLDVLGNGSFAIPYKKQGDEDEVISINPQCPPLVIITTNEDRELPAAFVRRCVVLNQNPPDPDKAGDGAFCDWLQQRGKAHDYLQVAADVAAEAAAMVLEDRLHVVGKGFAPVGLAEYIDLLRALSDLAPADATEQHKWLKKLRGYALLKQRDIDQQQHRGKAADDNS